MVRLLYMPVAKPLHVAVVGLGAIGRKHADILRSIDGCAKVSIADPSPLARIYAETHRLKIFGGVDELLAVEPPDAAVVAVPTGEHLRVAETFLEHRIPLLIEKPIADSVVTARKISMLADATSVPVLIGHHRRFNPLIQAAAREVAKGTIGRPITATVLYTFKKPSSYFEIPWHRERPGGGPLLINFIHEIDQLRFILGDIDRVQAMQSHGVRSFEVEDTAAVLLHFESGALATITVSDSTAAPWAYDLVSGEWDLMSGNRRSVERGTENTHFISGTEGSITLPNLRVYRFEGDPGWASPMQVQTVEYERGDPYVLQAAHFLRVAAGEQKPLVTAADATRTLEITLAVKTAAATGQLIEL
jgi:predicted dehydrogenase